MTQSKKMARIAYDALNEKKGEDIKIIDIAEVSTLGDYFVIANGNSSSQVTALVDNVEEEMHKAGFSLRQREGRASGSWILLDFGDVIIHVFDKESRDFYNIERAWISAGMECSKSVSVILYFSHNFNCSFAEQYFPQS